MPLAKYEDALHFYVSTKININLHRSLIDQELNCNSANIQAYSVNNRTFEINAVGSFQLTDIRPDVAKHYIPGVEIETFNSASEFIQKSRVLFGTCTRKKTYSKKWAG